VPASIRQEGLSFDNLKKTKQMSKTKKTLIFLLLSFLAGMMVTGCAPSTAGGKERTAQAQEIAQPMATTSDTAKRSTAHLKPVSAQCQGITKKGERCKRIVSKGVYYYQHLKS
jgi:hypothetical protein